MRYKILGTRFFSAELIRGKIELKPTHSFSCFFIVQHTDDKHFIKEQALQLLLAGCRIFHFFGTYASEWKCGINEARLLAFPVTTSYTTVESSAWDSLDEFIEQLRIALTTRGIVPCDYYLLYDDEKLYQQVLSIVSLNMGIIN